MARILENIILLFTTLYPFTGCFGLFDSSSDKIIGRYAVTWIDLPQNQMLIEQDELHSSNSSIIIPAYLFSLDTTIIILFQSNIRQMDLKVVIKFIPTLPTTT
jgi:hypothetical protein